jgi:hypothetical protein
MWRLGGGTIAFIHSPLIEYLLPTPDQCTAPGVRAVAAVRLNSSVDAELPKEQETKTFLSPVSPSSTE